MTNTSYQEKIAQAEQLINQHNSNVEDANKLDWKKILSQLNGIGATSEAALAECKWEDLESCGIPRLLARRIANEVFRTKSTKSEYVSDKLAERMSPEELLARYNPDDLTNTSIANKLKKLGNGYKFIVFNKEGMVDVTASLKLLQEIQRGFGEREIYVNPEGRSCRIYAIGDKPNNLVDQNPLYPSRVLRPDGTCDQTNRSWEGIPAVVRLLLFLAITKTSEVNVTNDKAHDLLDIAVREDAEKLLRKRYAKASVVYDELAETNSLPTLKVAIKRPNKDFIGGENRVF